MIPFNKIDFSDNACSLPSGEGWLVSDLIARLKDNPHYEYELDTWSLNLNITPWGEHLTMYDLANHYKTCVKADLKYPVIMSEEGVVLDGWHRLLKAIIIGQRYVKVVRFKINPPSSLPVNPNQ